MEKFESSLKHLPAYQIYDQFNKLGDENGYDNYFKNSLTLKERYEGTKELCKKITSNLRKISHLVSTGEDIDELCKYLNFWLYYQIKEHVSVNKGNIYSDGFIHSIYDGWNSISNMLLQNKCNVLISYNTSLDEWVQGKIMYDYFKNFQYISDRYNDDPALCQEYHKYITSIKEYYTIYKSKCFPPHSTLCSYYMKYDEKYDPNILLSNLKCTDIEVDRRLNTKEVSELSDGVETLPSPRATLLEHSPVNNEVLDTNSSNIVGISVSVLGLFIIFSMLYKFTPLVPWIREKILGKTINFNNIDNVTEELLQDNSEFIDISQHSDILHVAYNPA
ncbi:Plasmodium vivax Vir protein, putative [Plasmodium ovale]|uniref:Plasmodium vivax Vir protein, putative n=1 Tax=Plasmodium ovale TaxID=36330 RepID=A0A1C3KK56_PLAOA|nr:Plasmodium vivax Vir protein, putative [Plasmodium ovale]